MLTQIENKAPVTSHQTDVQLLAGEVVEVKQPGIAMRIGTALDPGIERKLRPNEDTLSGHPGYHSLCLREAICSPHSGRRRGRTSAWARSESARCAVPDRLCVRFLCSQQMKPQTFLDLLTAGVKSCQPGGVST